MPSIDINSNVPRQQFTAAASQTVFNVNFLIFKQIDCKVFIDETELDNTDFTVTNLGDEDGATVTLDTPLVGGEIVTIFRETVIQRGSQYQQDGRFDADPLERDFDIITTILQELSRNINRALTLNVTDSNALTTLPPAITDRGIVWNADGTFRNTTSSLEVLEGNSIIVANNIANINTVAGIDSEVTAVAGNETNINTVATNITSVNTVATNIADVITAAGLLNGFLSSNNTFTGDNVFQGVVDVTNINAETSAGGKLRTNGGVDCLSFGSGGANLTAGANLSMNTTHKIVNMADPTSDQDAATKKYVDDEIAGIPFILSNSYDSGNQTITSAGALTLAHSLGGVPKITQCFIKCTTAEHGYSIGDEVWMTPSFDTATNRNFMLVADAANYNIRFGSTNPAFNVLNKTTGAFANITNSSWAFIVRGYA